MSWPSTFGSKLERFGSTAVQADDTRATTVVLLSNHSSLAWVAREVQPRDSPRRE